ncbi:MAG TPA: type II secretion system F family protein [Verrucomicrobiae bacterium]|nr:type II secretion system F family protein [Verrucomicrobiae bacterium]
MIVTPRQLSLRAELYHQLGSMISAGIPLIRALEMAVSNPTTRVSRGAIEQLIASLKSGLTFSESMTAVHGWMPDFDIALLGVGEKSGRLDASFRQLSAYYAARAKIIRDTIAGLIIALATLHVFLLVFPLNMMVAAVQGLWSNDYGPLIRFAVQKLLIFGTAYGLVFLFIFLAQGNRAEVWRSLVEKFLRVIPMFGTARHHLVLARLSAALEALVTGGISIVQSWELAAAASGSPELRRRVARWKPELERGATPAELVNSSRYFPETFANLYSSGEQSGQLDEMLGRIKTYFEEDGFRRLSNFSRVMNGTIYGLVVMLVGYNVITFYMERFGAMFEAF